MHVQNIMTARPLVCRPQSNLAEAARLMWQGDCGIVPVTDNAGRVVGVLTDRDICIASWSKNRLPSDIRASEVIHGDVIACRPEDDVQRALTLMKEHRVRRLPVTTADGTLKGMLSLNDVVLAAGGTADIKASQVVDTFKAVCAHRTLPSVAAA